MRHGTIEATTFGIGIDPPSQKVHIKSVGDVRIRVESTTVGTGVARLQLTK